MIQTFDKSSNTFNIENYLNSTFKKLTQSILSIQTGQKINYDI